MLGSPVSVRTCLSLPHPESGLPVPKDLLFHPLPWESSHTCRRVGPSVESHLVQSGAGKVCPKTTTFDVGVVSRKKYCSGLRRTHLPRSTRRASAHTPPAQDGHTRGARTLCQAHRHLRTGPVKCGCPSGQGSQHRSRAPESDTESRLRRTHLFSLTHLAILRKSGPGSCAAGAVSLGDCPVGPPLTGDSCVKPLGYRSP